MLICATFLWAGGAIHLLLLWNIWHSAYLLEGVVKAIAAIVSVATAVVALRMAPMVLKIATPKELATVYDSLSGEVEARRAAEEKLRVHVQAELLASEDKLRLCFEGASQAILGVGGDGRIAILNRRTEEMFGYTRTDLLGQNLEILLPERFRTSYLVHRDNFFAAPRAHTMGEWMALIGRRQDGTEFPIEIGLSHVNTPEGPLAFGMVSDISERKNAAGNLERVNEDLRRSYIEIEQFAHVASHDLQEPLRMVTSYLQLIERRYTAQLDDEAREFIGYAVEGAKRMKALIRDLLEFSRAGAGATELREVNINSVLEDALDNLKNAIEESRAQITADQLPTIVADPTLLIQVFQNLIANAIKFQENGAPSIHISAQRQGADWILSVRDNGIGIEARHLDRIFKIFERLHALEKYSGSGIGLAITKKIVERHGGRIWIESQPGIGSTFSFSLPSEMGNANHALGASG